MRIWCISVRPTTAEPWTWSSPGDQQSPAGSSHRDASGGNGPGGLRWPITGSAQVAESALPTRQQGRGWTLREVLDPARGQRPRLAGVNICRSFGDPAVCGVTGGGSLWLVPGCFRPPLFAILAHGVTGWGWQRVVGEPMGVNGWIRTAEAIVEIDGMKHPARALIV